LDLILPTSIIFLHSGLLRLALTVFARKEAIFLLAPLARLDVSQLVAACVYIKRKEVRAHRTKKKCHSAARGDELPPLC
jgi:hypothetical protein